MGHGVDSGRLSSYYLIYSLHDNKTAHVKIFFQCGAFELGYNEPNRIMTQNAFMDWKFELWPTKSDEKSLKRSAFNIFDIGPSRDYR